MKKRETHNPSTGIGRYLKRVAVLSLVAIMALMVTVFAADIKPGDIDTATEQNLTAMYDNFHSLKEGFPKGDELRKATTDNTAPVYGPPAPAWLTNDSNPEGWERTSDETGTYTYMDYGFYGHSDIIAKRLGVKGGLEQPWNALDYWWSKTSEHKYWPSVKQLPALTPIGTVSINDFRVFCGKSPCDDEAPIYRSFFILKVNNLGESSYDIGDYAVWETRTDTKVWKPINANAIAYTANSGATQTATTQTATTPYTIEFTDLEEIDKVEPGMVVFTECGQAGIVTRVDTKLDLVVVRNCFTGGYLPENSNTVRKPYADAYATIVALVMKGKTELYENGVSCIKACPIYVPYGDVMSGTNGALTREVVQYWKDNPFQA